MRLWVIVAVVLVIILIAFLRSFATIYTDYLWFGSVNLSNVWRHLLAVKLGLFFGFAAVFFIALWVSLAVVDRVAPGQLALGPEDELVRRYQRYVAPRALLVRSIVALVVALIAASSALGQWSNFLLFVDGVSFTGRGSTDPQFHKNIGFFMFKLPFLSFLVSWTFVSLIVITIFTLIAHYLNGGIRVKQGRPTASPQVKVHLSVLLACMALVKAIGYYLGRYNLDLSQNGYVQGAGYTDVHARLPAYTLLMVISLLAIVILGVNVWQRGWALPILAVGLWAFVAIVVGAIYPAIVQALKVSPAQNHLEGPYIARNISATRRALELNNIKTEPFAASASASVASLEADTQSLDDVRLWDPEWTGSTFTKQQALYSYYSFNTLTMDRYDIDGQLVPMVVGVRQVNTSDLPAQGWVNVHLQYTHGYGAILTPANASSNGQPVFDLGSLPPVSALGSPKLSKTGAQVYFGLSNPNGGDANYVVADTRQSEVDDPAAGTNQDPHYTGTGGVELNNFVTRAAFALRFGDINLLVSDRLTPQSRLMYVRDVVQMAQKAAPFLSFDSDPYPVVADGQIYWIINAYTTSDNYPYAQNATTASVAPNGGLATQTFNYVRNSVDVVVNAYSGHMTFYDISSLTHSTDPILETWKKVFPGMFKPASQMPKALIPHLRYPEDLFTVQAAMYGRYHLTNVQAFYSSSGAWNVSESPGAGSPNAAIPSTYTTNAQGQVISATVARMAPVYETFALPGQSQVSFNLIDAYVPYSASNERQTLSGFFVAGCDPGSYGKLTMYVTPTGQDTAGPALVDALITQNTTVSKDISLLNTNGSQVILGNVLMLPVGQSMLYFRPFYVQSSRNAFPQLDYVLVVYSSPSGSGEVAIDTTLQAALSDVFTGLAIPNPSANGSLPSQKGAAASALVRSLIDQATQEFQQAQSDLKAGNFAAYGTDETNLQNTLDQLQQASGASSPSSSGSSTTTTTTTAPSDTNGVALRTRPVSPKPAFSEALANSAR